MSVCSLTRLLFFNVLFSFSPRRPQGRSVFSLVFFRVVRRRPRHHRDAEHRGIHTSFWNLPGIEKRAGSKTRTLVGSEVTRSASIRGYTPLAPYNKHRVVRMPQKQNTEHLRVLIQLAGANGLQRTLK